MMDSSDASLRKTGMLFDEFGIDNIIKKVNVLDSNGVNRWNRVKVPE